MPRTRKRTAKNSEPKPQPDKEAEENASLELLETRPQVEEEEDDDEDAQESTVQGEPVPIQPFEQTEESFKEEEEEEETLGPKYCYTNFVSDVSVAQALGGRSETTIELLTQLEQLDQQRGWRSRAEIQNVFRLEKSDELSLAAALAERGVSLQVVGDDRFRVIVWET